MRRKKKFKVIWGVFFLFMLAVPGEKIVLASELFQDGIGYENENSDVETEIETGDQNEQEMELFSSGEEQEMFKAPEEVTEDPEEIEFTAAQITSGTVKGTKVTWKFLDGVLTVGGKGAVPDYIHYIDMDTGIEQKENVPPWLPLMPKVEEIKVSNGVTELGNEVFSGCVNTKKVTIAGSVKRIGSLCFHKCKNLTEINLTDGLEIIDDAAFNYCPMTEITIPSTVRDSENSTTFRIGLNGMVNLKNVYVKGNSKSCKSVDGVLFMKNGTELAYVPPAREGTYEIPSGTKVIRNNVFAGIGLTGIKIPSTVTKIGPEAFYYCYNLKELTFPGSVKSIPESLCESCENLTSVIFENGVKEIKENAFLDCISLSSVKLPDTMRKIEKNVFRSCKALKSVKIPSSLINLSNSAFDKNTELIINRPIPNYNKIENGEYIFSAPVKVKGKGEYKEVFALLSAINNERKKAGSPALVMDKKLLECAMKRAAENALYSSHTRPVNRPYYSMNPKIDGELICSYAKNSREALKYWMKEYGWQLTFLNSSYKSAGIGCMNVGGVKYWTICFGEAKGTAVRSSSYKDKTVTHKVLVALEDRVCEPELFLTKTSMKKGETAKVQVFWNGKYLTDSGIKLVSSDPKVCKVEKGSIRGVAPGTAVIYAYYGENKEYAQKLKIKITK